MSAACSSVIYLIMTHVFGPFQMSTSGTSIYMLLALNTHFMRW